MKAEKKQTQAALTGHCTLAEMEREAIAYIRAHEPAEGYYVGFSGGKDSIVTLELVKMSGVKYEAYYTCTRIDPPEVVKFIKAHYPDVHWLFPEKSFFWALKHKYFPPLMKRRWCCDYLKKNPSRSIPLPHRIMGLRAEESTARAKRPRDDYVKSCKQWLYKPIFHWKEWAVWEFIERHSLPYPSLYDEGFDRIGCIVCPFIFSAGKTATASRIRQMERYPGVWKAFEHAVKEWWETKAKPRLREGNHTNADDYYKDYITGFTMKDLPRVGPNGQGVACFMSNSQKDRER